LPRVGIELDTIVEPADEHLLGMQRDADRRRGVAPTGVDLAMRGKRGKRGVRRSILCHVETEHCAHGRVSHLDDPSAERSGFCRDLLEHACAFVLGEAAISIPDVCLKERDARALPANRHRRVRGARGRALIP